MRGCERKLYTIGAILSAASLPVMGLQMMQSSSQAKDAEEQAEKQQEVMRQHNDLLKKQNQKLDEIRKTSPNIAAIASQAVQKTFASFGFVNNLYNAGKSAFGSSIKSNIISGAVTGIGTYGAAKYLQNKANKEQDGESSGGMGTAAKIGAGIGAVGLGLLGAKKGVFGNTARLAVNKQIMKVGKATNSNSLVRSGLKDYQKGVYNSMKKDAMSKLPKGTSELSKDTLANIGKNATKQTKDVTSSLGLTKENWTKPQGVVGKTTEFLRDNKGSIGMGLAFGAAPTLLGGAANSNATNEQVEKTYSNWGSAISSFWKNSKFMPGKGFSNQVSNLATMGLGGTKNIQNFGDKLIKLGNGMGNGTASNMSVKVGEWIKKNPIYANYAAIVPGAAVGGLAFDGTTKLVNKVTNTVDPNASKFTGQQ